MAVSPTSPVPGQTPSPSTGMGFGLPNFPDTPGVVTTSDLSFASSTLAASASVATATKAVKAFTSFAVVISGTNQPVSIQIEASLDGTTFAAVGSQNAASGASLAFSAPVQGIVMRAKVTNLGGGTLNTGSLYTTISTDTHATTWGNDGGSAPDSGSGPLGWLVTIAVRIGASGSGLYGLLNTLIGTTNTLLTTLINNVGASGFTGDVNSQLSTVRAYLNLSGTGLATLVGSVVGQTLASLLDSIKANTSNTASSTSTTATNTGAGGTLDTDLTAISGRIGATSSPASGSTNYLLSSNAAGTLRADLAGIKTDTGNTATSTLSTANSASNIDTNTTSAAADDLFTGARKITIWLGNIARQLHGDVSGTLRDAADDTYTGTRNAAVWLGNICRILAGSVNSVFKDANGTLIARFNTSTAGVNDIAKLIAANNRTLLTGTLLVLTGAGRLFRVVVQVAPSAGVTFYDNTSAAGVSVLFVPASAAAGTIYQVECPMAVGIYASFAGTGTLLVTFSS